MLDGPTATSECGCSRSSGTHQPDPSSRHLNERTIRQMVTTTGDGAEHLGAIDPIIPE